MAEAHASAGVGRYRLGEIIGRGGMGVVYRGYDPLLEREVAVKIIDPSRSRPRARETLRHEAMTVAGLDHPGVVPVHDLLEDEHGRLHVVMPLVRGVTLRDLLAGRPLSLAATVAVSLRIADALRYCHARGVVHRDIKPDNVMIVEHDRHDVLLKLMDFGLAASPGVLEPEQRGRVYGTVGYLSPEQALGLAVDERSDLYALGVVIFECCTGTLPRRVVPGDEPLDESELRPSSKRADVPPALDELVVACLRRSPELRPRSSDEVWESLERLADTMTEPLALGVGRPQARHSGQDHPTVGISLGGTTLVEDAPGVSRSLGAVLLVHGEYEAAAAAFAADRRARRRAATLDEELLDLRWEANLAHKQARYEEAIELCDRALSRMAALAVARPVDAAMLHAWASLAASAAGWLPVARERASAAEREAESIPAGSLRAETLVLVLRARGNLLAAEGRPLEAASALTEALGHGEVIDDAWERSIARFNLGEALAVVGETERARAYLEHAAEEKLVIGDRWGLAYVYRAQARIRRDRGELARAEERLRVGARLAQAVADPKLVAMIEVDRGGIALDRGRSSEASRRADEALDAARKRGARAEECGALVLRARSWREDGRPDEAQAFARAALELAAPVELGPGRAAALAELALAHADVEQHERALALLDEARALVVDGDPMRALEIDVARVEALGVVDVQDGDDEVRGCRARAEQRGARLLAARARAVLARRSLARGEGRGAELGADALAALEVCGADGLATRLRRRISTGSAAVS